MYERDFDLSVFLALERAFLLLATLELILLSALFLADLSLDPDLVFFTDFLDLAWALLALVRLLEALRTAERAALREDEAVFTVLLQVFPVLERRLLTAQRRLDLRRVLRLRVLRLLVDLVLRRRLVLVFLVDLRRLDLDLDLVVFLTLLDEVNLAENLALPVLDFLMETLYLETLPFL